MNQNWIPWPEEQRNFLFLLLLPFSFNFGQGWQPLRSGGVKGEGCTNPKRLTCPGQKAKWPVELGVCQPLPAFFEGALVKPTHA